MPRFFEEGFCAAVGGTVMLTGENSRHMTGSLRMKTGEEFTVCDNAGSDYRLILRQADKDSVRAEVLGKRPVTTEPAITVCIYQCIPKSDKLETIIQKCTELGVSEFTPVKSSRCIAKLEDKSREKKLRRYQKIALEAAKQSGRGKIPRVNDPMGLQAALESAIETGDTFFCYEKGGEPLCRLLENSTQRLNLLIGPEGGFSEEEAELAVKLGAKAVTLGKRILRTETAPVAVTAAIMYAKGEWQ